ncbi:hypothetical protein BD410DRAFT_810586 [Rickenella mellea]|uniref:Uncharacterized protein n=1 Tax=Rickenella mellea TaxID=50990 RepID=A0A4Y7PEH2_9AGAM|nr:hypothetical protein BD410DRAFT_810586 [Rickenella mellea]
MLAKLKSAQQTVPSASFLVYELDLCRRERIIAIIACGEKAIAWGNGKIMRFNDVQLFLHGSMSSMKWGEFDAFNQVFVCHWDVKAKFQKIVEVGFPIFISTLVEFRHYFPQLLELVVSEASHWKDIVIEVVPAKLNSMVLAPFSSARCLPLVEYFFVEIVKSSSFR